MNYYYLIILTCLLSCNISDTTSKKVIQASWDKLHIQTHGYGLDLSDKPSTFINDDKNYYTNYNHVTHQLLFYNLNDQSFSFSIDLKKSGPHKIENCTMYTIIDSMVISKGAEEIVMFDMHGKVNQRIEFPQELIDKYKCSWSKRGWLISNMLDLTIDHHQNSIFLPLFNKAKYEWEKGYYDTPMAASFSLSDNKVSILPISFPEELKKEILWGDLAIAKFAVKRDSLLYNFSHSSKLYYYNLKTGEQSEHSFTALNIPETVEGIKRNTYKGKKMRRKLGSKFFEARYHHLKYDYYEDRFYLSYNTKKKKTGDKDIEEKHLIVFDKDLNKLGEFQIPQKMSSEYVITSNGLLFRSPKEDSFETLTLHRLNIDIQ